ncbi:MAG TPA: hypothetical protein VEZ40_19490 [Pyrinomonadaceae bacterium]|jgi:hypothetical protein|nr:hypothetical protein [Pyrinomonadaceae bacterium]
MIDVKQATKIAAESFISLYDEQLSSSNIQLEEVELTEDNKYWLITLSTSRANANALGFPLPSRKEYKIFKVNAETGDLKSMKIREVA